MTQILLAIIGSGALTTIISCGFTYLSAERSAKSGLTEGVQYLLLAEIKRQGRQYILEGHITLEELEAFVNLFNAYKRLGGNGYADMIMQEVMRLPIKEEEHD